MMVKENQNQKQEREDGVDQWLFDHFARDDGRKKLLKCQEERIVYLHTIGYSYEAIRTFFLDNISKSTAYYIVNPGKYKSNSSFSNILQAKRAYRTKEQKAQANRKHMQKKRAGNSIAQIKLSLL